jgi:hypothetical protein
LFSEPPPAPSGIKYETTDDRCAACLIYGGSEPPCQPQGILRKIEQESGRPCPRADLESEDNVPAARMAFVLMSEEARAVAPDLPRAFTRGMEEEDRSRILERALAAVHDKEVIGAREEVRRRRVAKLREERPAAPPQRRTPARRRR